MQFAEKLEVADARVLRIIFASMALNLTSVGRGLSARTGISIGVTANIGTHQGVCIVLIQ